MTEYGLDDEIGDLEATTKTALEVNWSLTATGACNRCSRPPLASAYGTYPAAFSREIVRAKAGSFIPSATFFRLRT